MKNIKQALICWRGTAACVSGSLLMLAGLNAVAQPFASPVGDWDVVMSGSRVGVARFTFNGDHTISASEVMIPKEFITKPKDTRGLDDSRNTTGDDGRNGITVTNTPLPPHTNQFGFVGFPSPVFVPELDSTQPEVNFTNSDGSAVWIHNGNPPGHWNFDLSGRIVGFFTELSSPMTITTNLIPIGNPTICCCTTNVVQNNTGGLDTIVTCLTNQPQLTNVEVLRLTNAVNFTGKVSLNLSDFTKSRLTLLATTPAGKATFSGLIPIELPDISGTWFGVMRRQGLPYNEFFTLSNSSPFYDMDGEGPGYLFQGGMMVVRQKKFGYVVDVQAPPFPTEEHILRVRAVTGPVDFTHGKISGQGLQGDSETPTKISYKANLIPPTTE